MPKLILNDKEVHTLDVVIDDKTYAIPLGSSLSQAELEKLSDIKKMRAFIESHLWPGALDELQVRLVKQIIDAWSEETAKETGISLGKRSASRNSRKSTARR